PSPISEESVMSSEDQVPRLFGPTGRIPQVEAVSLTRSTGITALREGWRTAHTVVLVLVAPLLFVSYHAAADPSAGVLGVVVHGALALMASVLVTTYLPLRRGETPQVSSCAVVPALMVVAAGVALNSSVFPGGEAAALAVLSFGLWQRLSGVSTCGVTTTGPRT
ncbi:MAG: hypothetical protein WAQ75_05910, partial [Propionicimonas sp.]